MSEDRPFAPPTDVPAPPYPPRMAPTPSPPAPSPPAPYPPAPYVAYPPPPGPPVQPLNAQVPPRRRRPGRTALILIASITAGALLITGVGWVATIVAQRVAAAVRDGIAAGGDGDAPNARHDPQDATGAAAGPSLLQAPHPLDCAGPCLPLSAAEKGIRPGPDELRALETPTLSADYGDVTESTPADDYESAVEQWDDAGSTNDGCFFTYLPTPVVTGLQSTPGEDFSVTAYLPEYTGDDDYPILAQTARSFDDSTDAVAHMSLLNEAIESCGGYSTDSDQGWDATVTGLSGWSGMPADIAVVGWVEDAGAAGRFYAVDLQRGNLVVRTTLAIGHDSGDAMRAFATRMADLLERLPADPATSPRTARPAPIDPGTGA